MDIQKTLGVNQTKFAELVELERTGLNKKMKEDGRTLAADDLIDMLRRLSKNISHGNFIDLLLKIFSA